MWRGSSYLPQIRCKKYSFTACLLSGTVSPRPFWPITRIQGEPGMGCSSLSYLRQRAAYRESFEPAYRRSHSCWLGWRAAQHSPCVDRKPKRTGMMSSGRLSASGSMRDTEARTSLRARPASVRPTSQRTKYGLGGGPSTSGNWPARQ